jgi:hypothetical protein
MTTHILTEAERREAVKGAFSTSFWRARSDEDKALLDRVGEAVEAALLAKLAAMHEPVVPVSTLSRMFESLEGLDREQPGYHRKAGWNDALRRAMDYAHPPAAQDREDAERWRWLASDCDGNAQDDFLRWLSGTVAPKATIDAAADAAMKGTP